MAIAFIGGAKIKISDDTAEALREALDSRDPNDELRIEYSGTANHFQAWIPAGVPVVVLSPSRVDYDILDTIS